MRLFTLLLFLFPLFTFGQKINLVIQTTALNGDSKKINISNKTYAFRQVVGQQSITGQAFNKEVALNQGFLQVIPAENKAVKERIAKPIIYPNPTKDKLNISLAATSEHAAIIVYHTTGKEALRTSFNNQSFYALDTSSLHNGTYLLQITTNNQIFLYKILKL